MSTILPKPYSIFQIQNRKSNRIWNASCMRSCCVYDTLPVLFTGNAVLHVVNGCEFLIWVLDFSRGWSSRPRKYDHRSSSHLKKIKNGQSVSNSIPTSQYQTKSSDHHLDRGEFSFPTRAGAKETNSEFNLYRW